MKQKNVDWRVIAARLVALAGLFVTGGSALELLPSTWQPKAAAVAAVIIAVSSALPPVHGVRNEPNG